MKKILLCTLIAMILIVPIALADNKLVFSEVTVKVDGDNEDVSDGEEIEVRPGDDIQVKVELTNTYTTDIEIRNVDVEIKIQDFDDGDDEEDSEDADDIGPGDTEKVKFDFQVPWDIGDDTYTVFLTATGKEKGNNSLHKANFTFKFEVDRKKHEVVFTKAQLSAPTIKCGQSTDLSVSVLNIGKEDEDDTTLQVSNSDLELDQKSTFDLESGEFDDDMKATKNFRIATTDKVEPGVYPLNIKLTYDEGDEIETKIVDLTVTSCEVPKVEEPKVEEKKEEVVVQAPPPVISPPQLAPPVTGLTVEDTTKTEETGFMDQYGVAIVVLLYGVVIAIAALVFVFVFKRPRE